MTICSISMVRNEADVIEAFVRYHATILDRIIVVDHKSTDGTSDILRTLKEEGLPLDVRQFNGFPQAQSEVLSALLQELQEDQSVDWIVPLDGDEFLVERDGDVRSAFKELPHDCLTEVSWITHVPTPDDDPADRNILTRMRHCRTPELSQPKVIVPRGLLPDFPVFLAQGNHFLRSADGSRLSDFPTSKSDRLALAHYPVRSEKQLRKKVLEGWAHNCARSHAAVTETYQWRRLFPRCADPRPFAPEELSSLALTYAFDGMSDPPVVTQSPFVPPSLQLTCPVPATAGDDPAFMLRDALEGLGSYANDLKAERNRLEQQSAQPQQTPEIIPQEAGMKLAVCTVATKNHLPAVRTLFWSIKRFHPHAHCTVLLCDRPDGYIAVENEPFDIIFAENLPISRFTEMTVRYAPVELCVSLKPHLIRHLLQKHRHVLYFDTDILVMAPLTRLMRLLDKHDFILTPHMGTPIRERDGQIPTEETILRCGIFNLGFLAVRNTPQTKAMLDWWADRLTDRCYHWPPDGYYGDQRWMDLCVPYFPGMHVLRHPGYNVAYWNLHERLVEGNVGRFTVNGERLVFFHFSAFDPHAPDRLTRHPIRHALSSFPPLQELCTSYSHMLLERGYDACKDWPYSYGTFDNGVPLTSEIRSFYTLQSKESRQSFGDPFRTGPGSFYEWMQEPTIRPRRGNGYVTRLQLYIVENFGHTYFPVEKVRQGNVRALAHWLFLPHRIERFRLHPELLRSLAPLRPRPLLHKRLLGLFQRRHWRKILHRTFKRIRSAVGQSNEPVPPPIS